MPQLKGIGGRWLKDAVSTDWNAAFATFPNHVSRTRSDLASTHPADTAVPSVGRI